MHNLHYLEGLHSKWERERERERERVSRSWIKGGKSNAIPKKHSKWDREKEREMHYNLFDAFTLFRGTAF